jgi:hypothetical protein
VLVSDRNRNVWNSVNICEPEEDRLQEDWAKSNLMASSRYYYYYYYYKYFNTILYFVLLNLIQIHARHVTIYTMKHNVRSAEEKGKIIHIWLTFLPLCVIWFTMETHPIFSLWKPTQGRNNFKRVTENLLHVSRPFAFFEISNISKDE